MHNIAMFEFIGLYAEIINSSNKSLIGLKGKITDETKNTFTFEINGKEKKIMKNQVMLKISLNGKFIEIDGKDLVGRPEDRIKK